MDHPNSQRINLNNRYQLGEQIGAGGMADVYRAQDLLLERTVALKILRQDYSSNSSFRERFRQEAMSAANLSHPNIVTIYDFGFDRDRLFIVMEYLPGEDLKTIIQRRGKLPLSEALSLVIQACAGVGYAHRAGLVHCDVKPQNMLVTPDKRLKVTDFGIARALATIEPNERTPYVWGSPQYFSPEQAGGEAPSPASDVYSLGVVLFEMVTGQLPFENQDSAELARLHREMPPPSPRDLESVVPPILESIILKVLAKEPAARYRTADQFGRVLVNFSQSIPVPSQPELGASTSSERIAIPAFKRVGLGSDSQTEKGRRYLDIDWWAVVLGLLALIAVGGLIPFWLWVYFVINPPLR